MLHLENSQWSKVEQVVRETVLKPAPPLPSFRRKVGGGAVEQARNVKVEQNSVEQEMKNYPASAADARAIGAPRYFTGKPCPKGHVALRKTVNTTCIACHMEKKGGDIETRRIRNRRIRLALRGGCTPEMKINLIASQDGKCATCAAETELFVDHCHASNKIRAALCRSCNLALGMVKDQPDLLRTLAAYLEAHR